MSTKTITVTSSWTTIFNIKPSGYFGVHLSELSEDECQGSMLFMENGNINTGYETTVLNTRGIDIITRLVRNLPMTFQFEEHVSRTYEIRKTVDKFLEIRTTSGTDMQVKFVLFSSFPDKSIVLIPRTEKTNKTSFNRMGSLTLPELRSASSKCVTWMEDDITDYTIKIFDVTNNQELLSTVLSNTSESIQDLGTLSNLPSVSSQVDIEIKKNGGKKSSKVYIESLTIYYN